MGNILPANMEKYLENPRDRSVTINTAASHDLDMYSMFIGHIWMLELLYHWAEQPLSYPSMWTNNIHNSEENNEKEDQPD